MAMNKRMSSQADEGGVSGVSAVTDFKLVCRCCLKTGSGLVKLDGMTVGRSLDPAEAKDKIPLLRCLLFCIRVENAPELPPYICVECSQSLQVSYYFLQNAIRAHEILCRTLCPSRASRNWQSSAPRFNGSLGKDSQSETDFERSKPPKTMRHECQVCGDILYNRMEVSQHIRLHALADKPGKRSPTRNYPSALAEGSFVALKNRAPEDQQRSSHSQNASGAPVDRSRGLTQAAKKEDSEVKVCTLEDMELLIPTVLTPDDYAQPPIDADQLRDIEQQLAVSMGEAVPGVDTLTSTLPPLDASSVSIGTEYIVMADGTLQQVNGSGVVIEYIDDSKLHQHASASARTRAPAPVPAPAAAPTPTVNINLQNLLGGDDAMDIDVNELIVEDVVPQIKVTPKPIAVGSPIRKHKCKLCPKTFATLARLKSHQLTHSHLPKFFCDQCDFYSLRSAHLIQHYQSQHNRPEGLAEGKAEGTAQEPRSYSCDMCLYETRSVSELRSHYAQQHTVQPTEVELRPSGSWTNSNHAEGRVADGLAAKDKPAGRLSNSSETPVAIKYPPAGADCQQPTVATTTTVAPNGELNVVVDATPLFYTATSNSVAAAAAAAAAAEAEAAAAEEAASVSAAAQAAQAAQTPVPTVDSTTGGDGSNTFGIFPEISESSLPANEETAPPPTQAAAANTSNPNISIFGDMQEFIDNSDVAAICTIPADDMPVVDGDDIVIDNNNISLDFDAENLFEDFEEDEEAVGEDEEDDDEAENEDENDNNDAATDQNLLLTSDDDDVDDFDDEQSKHLQKPYCIYCNKKFTSQYKFENHMFVHRGLAPYRCELCTNLYNMKRLLIRHYKTVHKRMPTRDMVQAKGDKVSVTRTSVEKLPSTLTQNAMLMCAKCPFECESDAEMRKHLNAHHGINDGVSVHANEVFIIRKLPFECPRCIRSFAAKSTLVRHLQRSHLVETIIDMPMLQSTASSAATTTTTTATATISGPANSAQAVDKAELKVMMMASLPTASGSGDGRSGKDGGAIEETGAPRKTESTLASKEEIDVVSVEADTSLRAKTAAAAAAAAAAVAAAAAAASAISSNGETIVTTTSSPSPITTAASSSTAPFSTLYPPTPTPFDFETYDFMGDGTGQRTTTPTSHTHTHNLTNSHPNANPILNGSDKLLGALPPADKCLATTSPRLPRSPTYVCKLCNQTFDELGKLVKHETEMHSNTDQSKWGSQHKCAICNTSYRTLTLLKFHMKRHLNRKMQCKLCPKSFVGAQEIERHMKAKHAGAKTFRCNIDNCKKMFAYKHHMVRHQNATHLQTRHVCTICDKELPTSQHLRNHMSIHKATNNYKCPICDRAYLRRGR
ncbi:hypothetical protein KR018_005808 [Drosophila ironensis]|nr:hypothetical protein KR018_005808 [Drosophila ironensis]